MTEQPFAVAFRDKNNYVDLSGLGKIRWAAVRASGLHVVHLIIRLADGTWLRKGEHGYGSNQLRFARLNSPSRPREALDEDGYRRGGDAGAAPGLSRAIDAAEPRRDRCRDGPIQRMAGREPDLTKVDAVGFADLMPGSGHDYGRFLIHGHDRGCLASQCLGGPSSSRRGPGPPRHPFPVSTHGQPGPSPVGLPQSVYGHLVHGAVQSSPRTPRYPAEACLVKSASQDFVTEEAMESVEAIGGMVVVLTLLLPAAPRRRPLPVVKDTSGPCCRARRWKLQTA